MFWIIQNVQILVGIVKTVLKYHKYVNNRPYIRKEVFYLNFT